LLDNSQDKERSRVRSSSGFLDIGESFLGRLAIDSQNVLKLGVTHEHLALQLESVLKQAYEERKKLGLGPDAKVYIPFIYQVHPNESSQGHKTNSPQQLCVSHRSFMGSQWSFFRNLESIMPTEEDTICWKEDHEIFNLAFPSIILTISGGIGTGICHFILKYGFYEGGKTNIYRVDPCILHWVLSGKPSENAVLALKEFYLASKEDAQQRFNDEMIEITKTQPPLTSAEYMSIKQVLQQRLEQELSLYQLRMDELRSIVSQINIEHLEWLN
jgi:hypothetical protein